MTLVAHAVQRFCGVVEQKLGLDLQTRGSHDIERLLLQQSHNAHLTAEAYVERLVQGGSDEWQWLANNLTVGETYFFRHVEQLHACCDLIQRVCAKVAGQRRVRVLSAGCSSGEEAYSLAMLLHERGIHGKVEIVGLDVNPVALQRARAGWYSQWSLRETDAAMVGRWFHTERGRFRVRQEILEVVEFVQGNLVAPIYEVRNDYDLVLCRNVLMYFSPEQFQRAAGRLVQALRPGGALFLGHAESLRGIQLNVEAVHDLGAFFYRVATTVPTGVTMREEAHYAAPTAFTGRVDAETQVPVGAPRAESSSAATSLESLRVSLSKVEQLLHEERFADALSALEDVPSTGPASPLLGLRKGMLLVYNNRFPEAEQLLAPLLHDESLAAEAHYALALCHEVEESFHDALSHHRLAAHLDPTFAMPRLHLGLLYKRVGEQGSARRELLQARALLMTETPERVLWFGGGSSRAHLLDVCQDALDNTDERR